MNRDENPVEEPSPEPVAPTGPSLEDLIAERDALRDQMLRSMAEAQNVQRRLREQHREDLRFATQPLVSALLPVLDNLERSLAALEAGASVEKVIEGVRAIDKQLRQVLTAAKVERIDAVGKTFDPEVHEALGTVSTDEFPEGTVVGQVEPGYSIHGRVVRPARVQVAKKP
jgi:molecular chaperone GrpE